MLRCVHAAADIPARMLAVLLPMFVVDFRNFIVFFWAETLAH